MMTKFKIALSAAIVVGAASTGFAAVRHHPIRHQPAATSDQPGAGGSAYGYTPTSDRAPGYRDEYYIWVQDQYYDD